MSVLFAISDAVWDHAIQALLALGMAYIALRTEMIRSKNKVAQEQIADKVDAAIHTATTTARKVEEMHEEIVPQSTSSKPPTI